MCTNAMKSTALRLVLAVSLLGVLFIHSAQATPGALDTSFGSGGKVMAEIGAPAYANALVRQPDDKLVAAGYAVNNVTGNDFALARYNRDGSLDTTFGTGGKVMTMFGFSDDVANAVAVRPDGKIVAAGYTYSGPDYDFAVARYNPDGSPDTTFNGTGKVITPVGPNDDYGNALALQPDGKIVAAGFEEEPLGNKFALVRYNPDGSLDTSFNGTGKVSTPVGSDSFAFALALQPDGKLVAAGSGSDGSQYRFVLARYKPDGSLDAGFGSGGTVATATGPGYHEAHALALQPDGKLVAAGWAYNGTNHDFALIRCNPNGSLDTSFNGTGKVTTQVGPGDDFANALVLQPDGKLVAAGRSYNGSKDVFALARYNPNGSLDPGFGSGGKVATAVGSSNDQANALALQPDGGLVAAGAAGNGYTSVFALVRYRGSTLTVAKTGGGSGSVSSSPSGINCGPTCSVRIAAVPVTLTATPSAGSSFVGWSGSCSGGGKCTLTPSGDRTAVARFETNKTLTLGKAGNGSGTVSSSPGGISCGSACASTFRYGTVLTLTAAATTGSAFTGWSGACSGTATCTVTMTTAQSVTATFAARCIVPKAKGKALRAAKRALVNAHCSVGKVTKAFSAKVKKGRVMAQSAKPGKQLAPGAKVRLTTSKGKRP